MAGIFKAYDIRGTVPEQLNADLAWRIGHGFATFMRKDCSKDLPVCVVGRDMRSHSPELAKALMAGIVAAGGRVVDVGLCTTPMLYVAVGSLGGQPFAADAGIMVTASHNPAQYGGFKMCRAEAVPISGATGLIEIESLTADAPDVPESFELPAGTSLAYPTNEGADVSLPDDAVHSGLWARYVEYMRGFVKSWPERVKLACDPANGMGCLDIAILRSLGADVSAVFDTLDGSFPNHEANPLKDENLKDCASLVLKEDATIGVAFDGDSDRAVFIDERGAPVSSDRIVAALVPYMLSRESGAGVLYDLRSSRGVAETIRNAGGRPIRERVGHSFMKATLRKENALFGGELSGHFYFRDAYCTDNALLAVIEVLNALGAARSNLSLLISALPAYAQSGERNYHVEDKDAAMKRVAESFSDAEVDWLDGVTVQYDDWWVNVRPSNTEPLLRLNLEASDPERLAEHVAAVEAVIGGTPE